MSGGWRDAGEIEVTMARVDGAMVQGDITCDEHAAEMRLLGFALASRPPSPLASGVTLGDETIDIGTYARRQPCR